jgi:hypothetical protein
MEHTTLKDVEEEAIATRAQVVEWGELQRRQIGETQAKLLLSVDELEQVYMVHTHTRLYNYISWMIRHKHMHILFAFVIES